VGHLVENRPKISTALPPGFLNQSTFEANDPFNRQTRLFDIDECRLAPVVNFELSLPGWADRNPWIVSDFNLPAERTDHNTTELLRECFVKE
jgi:hypothetical protein